MSMRTAEQAEEVTRPGPAGTWVAWLDVVPIIWLATVLSGYLLVANVPLVGPPARPVPGLAEAERSLPCLLLALLAAAIIRYFASPRAEEPDPDESPACSPETGRDTA